MKECSTTTVIGTAILCICMTLLTISFVELLIRRDAEHEAALMRDTLLNTGALIAQEIQRNLSYGVVVTETLHALLESNDYDVHEFDKWGEQLTSIGSGVGSVQLAPDGIVSHIYPLKGNEGAIGHNLLKDKHRDDGALLAIQSRELTFLGPLKLIQNGKYAVIARKPVFRIEHGKEKFWGFTIALLLVDDVLPARVCQLDQQGLYIKLEGYNPDSETASVLFTSEKWHGGNDVAMRIEVPNGEWVLHLAHDPIDNKYYMLSRIVTIFFSVFFSAYVFVQQCLMSAKQDEISYLNKRLTTLSLKDELTGVGNRRAGMMALEKRVQESQAANKSLSVLMLDLDLFKQVNDNYGHPAGDSLLRHSALCLKKAVPLCDTVFRIGGDEFIMHFPEMTLTQCADVAERIVEFVKNMPCEYDGKELPMSFSIGIAEYRSDESIESLLRRVDDKLYEAKKAGRNTVKF